ncbi:MAG: hypothetical protein HPAVJP_2760 [Candidatus Hepatoplasma vulgare]|nr:MAG: hypothetical protein HPAVJP_2760 [Candidatus Hepatoplasma sp.]
MNKNKKIKIKKSNKELLGNQLLKYQINFDEKLSYKKLKLLLIDFFENNEEKYENFIHNQEILENSYWKKKKKEELVETLKKLGEKNIDNKTPKSLLINLILIKTFLTNQKEFDFLSKKDFKKINKLLNNRSKFERNIYRHKIFKNIFKKGFLKELNEYIGKYQFGFEKSDYDIDLKHVNKFFIYENKIEHVLVDLDLKIPKENMLIINGPSGAGKSTIINVISGLLETEDGDIVILKRNLKYLNEKQRTKFREENISFVFQSYNLIPTLTIKDNILLGADLLQNQKNKLDLKDIAKDLNIEEQLEKYPHQLSGGQKQRASIARALIKNPKILIADEPTGALDKKTGKDVLKIFKNIIEKYKTTIVLVTHNTEIKKIGDYILTIGNGKIESFTKNKNKISVDSLKMEV